MDKGHPSSMIALAATLPTLATISVALRFWARHERNVPLGLDDWLAIPALLLTIAMGVVLIIGVAMHLIAYPRPSFRGKEELYADPPQKVNEQKIEIVVTAIFVAQLGCIKCCILAFMRRIFCKRVTGAHTVVIQTMLIVCAIWSLCFFISFFFDCGLPLSNGWSPLIIEGKVCHSLAWEDAFALSDFLMDLIIFILPIPKIWHLHLSWKRKLGIMFIMMLATLAIVASLIRVIIVFTVVDVVRSAFLTFNGNILDSEVLWWMMLEAGVSVVVACLPVCNTIPIRMYFDRFKSSIRGHFSLFRTSKTQAEEVDSKSPVAT